MKFEFSVDSGKTWHAIPARINGWPVHWAGSLSMRLPAYISRFWSTGRRIDGKRTGKTSLDRSYLFDCQQRYTGGLN